ncbi:MAG TPA: hypothetical protein VL326_06030 [Kofleriaceae bacterium]|nr:hypothetical protein [Kofleriaceae bacterium]
MTRWLPLVIGASLAACASITGGGGGSGGDDDDSDYTPCPEGTGSGSGSAEPGLVFVMPYKAAPQPAEQVLETTAKLSRADVAILLDTTGSMTGTTTRIQGSLAAIVAGLNAEIPDVAFGAAGFGDFPVYDGANSQYDVPFYRVHRMMTARTSAGLTSIQSSFVYKNIITDGLGNWWSGMRGGDEPEQHWEALRQAATGVGISYPDPYGGATPRSVPAFSAAAAYPTTVPAGEEVGTLGGLGFRESSTPILIMITDTNAHDGGMTTTSPVSATRPVALASLKAIGAKVVGVMAWITVGHDDLSQIAIDTGGQVPPTTWGTGSARPANCPIGKCCTVAEDEVPTTQPDPDPVTGLCTLVFKADKYSVNLSKMVVQGVTAVAQGAKFQIGARLIDDPSDDVDVADFVERVEALPANACAGAQVSDADHDGIPETFSALAGGGIACFRIVPKQNTSVKHGMVERRFKATLQLTGDGVASFGTREVTFVVPGDTCQDPVIL